MATLTPLGDALSQLLTDDYDVRHPDQVALTETSSRLSAPRQDLTSTVYRAEEASSSSPPDPADGSDSPATAEEWLTATGKIGDGADYVQWLSGPASGGVMDNWGMHARLTAPVRDQGVTLVDHEIDALDDGRAGYLSCFDDTALAVVQLGGPLATLVRLSSILLSDKNGAQLLNRRALGDDLQEAYDGAFDDAVEDVLRYASQVGWLGEEQETWVGLRDRLQHVRDGFLRRLSEIEDGIHRCVHCETSDVDETYTYCPNCGAIACDSHSKTERLEGDPVCTGRAVTDRFTLKTKYFYDEENLDAFREEYADMPVHEKMLENQLLAGGSVVVTLLLIVSLLVVSGII